MLDLLLESLQVLRRHSARTLLTGLSVAWGVFTLVVLLAAGKGLENGAVWQFREEAVGSIHVSAGRISLPVAGQVPGREVRLSSFDVSALSREIDAIEHIGAVYTARTPLPVTNGERGGEFDVAGVEPSQRLLEQLKLTRGRFINAKDLAEHRKVAVLSAAARALLFTGHQPLGEHVNIGGFAYQVIGEFEDAAVEDAAPRALVPITTLQLLYSEHDRVREVALVARGAGVEEAADLIARVRALLGARHDFAPEDPSALAVQNNLEAYARLCAAFRWIERLVWAVGIATLVAGSVGVSNIMFIAVAERTQEIGLRRAIGATPRSVVGAVTAEAILLTTVAGYAGLLAGLALTEWVAARWGALPFMREPRVDLGVVCIATLLLVISGAVAGYIPAQSAARMSVVDALRGGP